jgi:hypothetical protein
MKLFSKDFGYGNLNRKVLIRFSHDTPKFIPHLLSRGLLGEHHIGFGN